MGRPRQDAATPPARASARRASVRRQGRAAQPLESGEWRTAGEMAVAPGRPRQMERQPSERWSLCEGEEARARDGRRRFGRRRGALGSRGVELERPGCAAAAGRGSPRDDRINAGTVQWAGPARSCIGLSFVSTIELAEFCFYN